MSQTKTDPRAKFDACFAALEGVRAEMASLGPGHPINAELDAAIFAAGGRKLARAKRTSTGAIDAEKARRILGRARIATFESPGPEDMGELEEWHRDRYALTEHRQKYPRTSQKEEEETIGARVLARIRAPFAARAEALWDDVHGREKEAEARLAEASVGLDGSHVRQGPEPIKVDWFYAGSYSSSGPRYSRGAAELALAGYRRVAPEIRLEIVDSAAGWDLVAWVASEADVALLKRLPGFSFREQVRWCWANGMQPRVFNPFLPHGYEEREGLDYFGHDLRAEACPKCGEKHGAKRPTSPPS